MDMPLFSTFRYENKRKMMNSIPDRCGGCKPVPIKQLSSDIRYIFAP